MKIILLLITLLCIQMTSLVAASDCTFTGDILASFGNCNPSSGLDTKANPDFSVVKSSSDFRTTMASLIKRIQIITSIIAIGLIVWIGLILVLPGNAEGKESAKSKVFSVLLGFLVMISATLIVSSVINILYDVIK